LAKNSWSFVEHLPNSVFLYVPRFVISILLKHLQVVHSFITNSLETTTYSIQQLLNFKSVIFLEIP